VTAGDAGGSAWEGGLQWGARKDWRGEHGSHGQPWAAEECRPRNRSGAIEGEARKCCAVLLRGARVCCCAYVGSAIASQGAE
jgi:hypothetical protein